MTMKSKKGLLMAEFVLYSYFRSSASYRARIAMNLKGLPYEYRAVHLLNNGGEQHQSAYGQLNPSHEVPTLVHNGKAIGQSMAILDYLDRVSPLNRLFPEEPYARAQVMQACEIVNSGGQPIYNLRVLQELGKKFGADQNAKDDWARHWLGYSLGAFETFVKDKAGEFCFGAQPNAADCFLIPHLAGADRFKLSLDPFPTLARIRKNCTQLDTFKKAAPDVQPDTPKT
jgi:maleylacetoacetate isomerase